MINMGINKINITRVILLGRVRRNEVIVSRLAVSFRWLFRFTSSLTSGDRFLPISYLPSERIIGWLQKAKQKLPKTPTKKSEQPSQKRNPIGQMYILIRETAGSGSLSVRTTICVHIFRALSQLFSRHPFFRRKLASFSCHCSFTRLSSGFWIWLISRKKNRLTWLWVYGVINWVYWYSCMAKGKVQDKLQTGCYWNWMHCPHKVHSCSVEGGSLWNHFCGAVFAWFLSPPRSTWRYLWVPLLTTAIAGGRLPHAALLECIRCSQAFIPHPRSWVATDCESSISQYNSVKRAQWS